MNITFENGRADTEIKSASAQHARSGVDKATTSHVGSKVFALDISGTVMDNTAYEGHGKTTEDVMQDAGQVDVATQKNYMAVMSNTMSDEDFAKLQEEGYHPGNTEIETVVTIVDEIKAALAKGGNNITGYTDDLDVETLTQITGSAGLAEEIAKQFAKHDIPVTKENVEDVLKACGMVTQLDELSDGVMKYMVKNQMEPTVENIYMAQYSAAADADKQGRGYYQDETGYYAKKAEEYNWQQLEPQMRKVIENAGLEVSKETLADAKWLIEKGMPLTEDNLSALYELRNLEVPDTMEDIVSAASAAIASGRNAGSANIADDRTDLEKAADIVREIEAISDEAVDKTAAEGRKLNLRNLKASQVQISLSIKAQTYSVSVGGRRLMEEVRLQMTVEANLHLIRSGFSIDTADLEQLVNALKEAEQQAQEMLFGEQGMKKMSGEASAIFNDTLSAVKELGGMPAALIGRFVYQGSASISVGAGASSFTLEAAYAQGSILRAAYEKAGESYETLMTSPRADLGDSIKKAFRNVDALLKDMDMEANDVNRRAVRILGYNRMEISEENMEAVKTADLTVQRVLNKMTPASALQMIREGINPLSMDMEELETYLDNQGQSPEQEIEKYSEFLYKLEKNNEVTESERDAYIGIYRLFRQLQKTDGAAIGALVNQGIQPTVKNLLSAMRSHKKQGMDVTVNDSFGGVTSAYTGKSISEQIGQINAAGSHAETKLGEIHKTDNTVADNTGTDSTGTGNTGTEYYRKLAHYIYDNLDGGIMDAIAAEGDMDLEQLAQMLRSAETEEEINREYIRRQAGEVRKALAAEESVIKELLDFDQPVTADNLLAAGQMMKERGKTAGRLHELAKEDGREEAVRAAVENLHEKMTDEESAKEAYSRLEETYTQLLDNLVYEQEISGRIDMREISSLYKRISLSGNMAKEENYEVPVEIEGEVTSINLKIIHNQESSGRVTAAMESAVYGKVAAQFMISFGAEGTYQMSGYIASDSMSGVNMMKQSEASLKEMLEQADIKIVSLNIIHNSTLDLNAALQTGASQPAKQTSPAESAAVRSRETAKADAGRQVSTKKLYETAKIFIAYIQKG